MSVDLRNYVQVNINYNKFRALNKTRDTAVLFTINEDNNAPGRRLDTHIPKNSTVSVDYFVSIEDYLYAIETYNNEKVVSVGDYYEIEDTPISYSIYQGSQSWSNGNPAPGSGKKLGTLASTSDLPEWVDEYTIDKDVLLPYVECFFDNGGIKLQIIGCVGDIDDHEQAMFNMILDLEPEKIIITSDAPESSLARVALMKKDITVISNPITGSKVDALSGYKEKLYISSLENDSISAASELSNYVIKYGPKGIEMAAAAYLTQIDIADSRSLQDYCYTIEDISMFETGLVNDNDLLVNLVQNRHFNVDSTLVNETRNIGGDSINGVSLIDYYLKIILTQTLTDKIISVLVSKIKFDKTGINKVSNAITQELNRYTSNGYLDTEFIWTNDDLYYSYNGVDYLVCSRNSPLKAGYKFIILPIESLTAEQRAKHIFPPIYVLLATSDSVRQIVINGDLY